MMRAWLVAVATTVGSAALGLAQGPPVSAVNVDAQGVALHGHDPVAYFTDGEAVPGAAQFEHQWHGTRWHFSNAANRDAFAKAPERYAPQFGGYCAWAVSRNYTAHIDPNAFAVVNGKRYVNYSIAVQARWRVDRDSNRTKAGGNWPGLLAQVPPKKPTGR